MRLLVTRATQDAVRTRAHLEAAGHSVVCAPVIEIVPSSVIWPAGIVDAVLATSSHAFSTLPSVSLPTLEARRLLPLFLVGTRTEEAARQSGFVGRAIVRSSAAELASYLEKFVRKRGSFVYLAGRDRKPDLETALAIAERETLIVETYDAQAYVKFQPAVIEGMRNDTIDGVLHFSRRSAALFLKLAKDAGSQPKSIRHFCLSEDVASPLRHADFDRIEVAEAPNEAALLEMIASVA